MALTLQQKLDEALEVHHKLMLGQSVTSWTLGVSGSSRAQQFTPADSERLERYIADLRRQIAGRPARRGRMFHVVPR